MIYAKAKISDEVKNKFDCLLDLEKMFWEEYKEKTSLEWKYSFTLWGFLATAYAGFLTGKLYVECGFLVYVILALVALGHIAFLYWIKQRLDYCREQMSTIRREMLKVSGTLGVKSNIRHKRCGVLEKFQGNGFRKYRKNISYIYKHLTLLFQALSTLLLVVLLVIVINSSSKKLDTIDKLTKEVHNLSTRFEKFESDSDRLLESMIKINSSLESLGGPATSSLDIVGLKVIHSEAREE